MPPTETQVADGTDTTKLLALRDVIHDSLQPMLLDLTLFSRVLGLESLSIEQIYSQHAAAVELEATTSPAMGALEQLYIKQKLALLAPRIHSDDSRPAHVSLNGSDTIMETLRAVDALGLTSYPANQRAQASSLWTLARGLCQHFRLYSHAIPLSHMVLSLRREILAANPDDQEALYDVALALKTVSGMEHLNSHFIECIPYSAESVAIFQRILVSPIDVTMRHRVESILANGLSNYTFELRALGRYRDAERIANVQIELTRGKAAKDGGASAAHALAKALLSRVEVLSDVGRREEALPLAVEAMELKRQHPGDLQDATYLAALALLLPDGDIKALQLLDEAVAMVQQPVPHPQLHQFRGIVFQAASNVQERHGRLVEATRLLDAAISAFRIHGETSSDGLQGLAECLASLARLNVAASSLSLARPLLKEALAVLRAGLEAHERGFLAPLAETLEVRMCLCLKEGDLAGGKLARDEALLLWAKVADEMPRRAAARSHDLSSRV
ncbi:hypothetical protein HKX48_009457 [Thoreauomyces humboldtii]|nr:hypothetical protein HKX48_009457 [Thoreauomyces humboldtii]